jgi:hypothetical protein
LDFYSASSLKQQSADRNITPFGHTKELSISMTKILHAVVKGGLLSYCDKVYSRGNINQKHRIGGVMVSVTSLLIYQTLFLVAFEYFYDVYLFEIKHVCKLNWPKRPSEILSSIIL